jgi:hypothetical protein
MTQEQMMTLLASMAAEIESLKAERSAPKNQVVGKTGTGKYVLVTKLFPTWGNTPQQQKDLAAILTSFMEVGKEYTETEVFAQLESEYVKYSSLASAKQHVTYLFRYYRGLKNDGKYAGFIARDFIRHIK